MDQFRILIKKESYKFSATHFTVFGPDQAERLHGHNYAVSVECGLTQTDELGMAFEFNSLKPFIKKTADLWDEFVLIPTANPYIKIADEKIAGTPHIIVNYADKSYRFPEADVRKLDVRNITSEELAKTFLELLLKSWLGSLAASERKALESRLSWVEVAIEETRGQLAAIRRSFKPTSEKTP